jgi:Ca2+-binding EF-hand superfamily protein
MEPGILPSEFKTQVRQMFEVSDMNHDNVLELDEYKQFTLYLLESLSAGVIGEDSTPIGDLFASFDKNKDGRLDWEEIWESMTVITEKLAEKATDKTATPLK